MADKIRLLPEVVANQIAAGEVVNRPASVVKEMMENAIDAGARTVKVNFRDGGKDLIQIVDDGSGMSPIDARMAFDRHATSKITSVEDIYALNTFGFRGEALASIAAVAQVELRTRQEGDEVGTQTEINGGQFAGQTPVMCPVGAQFFVRNLFYNVPARRRFLDKSTASAAQIKAEFQRVALCNPHIAFELYANDAPVYTLCATSLAGRIVDVVGRHIKQNLLEVDADTSIARIGGYIGRPAAAKRRNGEQYLFVNGRYFKSSYLTSAIMKAYEKLIPESSSPSYFLYLTIDPSRIDVNVHPQKTEVKFADEEAVYNFPSDYKTFTAYVNSTKPTFEEQFFNSFEQPYVNETITSLNDKRLKILPLLVDLGDGRKVCITEADLEDFPGMFLNNETGKPSLKAVHAPYPKVKEQGGHNQLQMLVKERENYIAKTSGTRSFPWRAFIISRNDKELADCDMVYRLASPSRVNDISWIKPGKVAWDWWNDWNLYGVDFRAGINNPTYKYYIDFAAEHGIEYVILDEGWAVNLQADMMQVIPEIDLQELVDYGKSKNVGIILWAGYWAFARDMENVVKHYSDMGVKGFKVDFLDRDDQEMVNFVYEASEVCAKYKMLVDFHGVFKPTGLQRTYPNVLNYEGVNGLEQLKWSPESYDMVTYDVTIPFIRMIAGPMDYTQGAMRNAVKGNYRPVNSEPMSQGTRCRQLATYVIFESPFNMLCDAPSNYMREPESTEFIANIPTVWDESIVLDGKMGEYIVTARRAGNVWYVGGITDWTARDIEVDCSFLGDKTYDATLFKDGVNAHRVGRDYKCESFRIKNDSKLKIHLTPGGGFALKIK